ncbi:MAG: hypothetical protein HC837_04005 [Chloroflexaceae bacterium]|nr:hypothetical protein [Chloroflexaceae bacterium]
MRISNYEQNMVKQVTDDIPGARQVLYTQGIDPTNRISLANAAAGATVVSEELMARLDMNARRFARQHQPAVQAPAFEQELELA